MATITELLGAGFNGSEITGRRAHEPENGGYVLPREGEVTAILIEADLLPSAQEEPEIVELLYDIKDQTRWRVAVVSCDPAETREEIAENLGVTNGFPRIIVPDELPRDPSQVSFFVQAPAMLEQPPERALYFGRGLTLSGAAGAGMGANRVPDQQTMVGILRRLSQGDFS